MPGLLVLICVLQVAKLVAALKARAIEYDSSIQALNDIKMGLFKRARLAEAAYFAAVSDALAAISRRQQATTSRARAQSLREDKTLVDLFDEADAGAELLAAVSALGISFSNSSAVTARVSSHEAASVAQSALGLVADPFPCRTAVSIDIMCFPLEISILAGMSGKVWACGIILVLTRTQRWRS